jgi:hypothetical protein
MPGNESEGMLPDDRIATCGEQSYDDNEVCYAIRLECKRSRSDTEISIHAAILAMTFDSDTLF